MLGSSPLCGTHTYFRLFGLWFPHLLQCFFRILAPGVDLDCPLYLVRGRSLVLVRQTELAAQFLRKLLAFVPRSKIPKAGASV